MTYPNVAFTLIRWRSSGVERVLGKDEVEGSNPSASFFSDSQIAGQLAGLPYTGLDSSSQTLRRAAETEEISVGSDPATFPSCTNLDGQVGLRSG